MKILKDRGTLLPNDVKFLTHPIVSKLLHDSVPEGVEGFTLDAEDQARMNHLWPVGDDAVDQIIHRFMKTKIRPRVFAEPALYPGAEEVGKADSKIGVYSTGRNRVDLDGTSRLSPYLAAGIVSARHCLRATLELTNNKINTDKSSSIGVFVSEVAWKDFYCHVRLALFSIRRGTGPYDLYRSSLLILTFVVDIHLLPNTMQLFGRSILRTFPPGNRERLVSPSLMLA